MNIKIKSNLVSGIAATVFAIILWLIIPNQIVDTSNKLIKSDFLPKLLAVIILICGIWLIAESLLKKKEETIVELNLRLEARVLVYMAALVLYNLVFDKLGFFFSSLLLALFTLVFVKEKKTSHYMIVAVYVAALFVIFKYALSVPLPTKFLG